MEKKIQMVSDAGRRYQKIRSIRPLNTPDRLRMYHSIQVEELSSKKKPAYKKPSMQTIDRQKNDSFFYRSNKDIVVNTHYEVNQSLVHPATRRQGFQKAKFKRIIGDVRGQDYSLPLLDDCDKRCTEAFITLPHQSTILTTSDTHKTRAQHHNLNFQKQVTRDLNSQSQNMKKINSLVSTQQSDHDLLNIIEPIKKRTKRNRNLQLHDALKRIRLFDHDIGHQYGDKLFVPKKVPEFYDIQNSHQENIKQSMSTPKGYVEFGSFRQKIATRLDRSDPYWGMTVNYEHTHENPEWKQAKTIKMEKISERRLNEVKSKYPMRHSLSLVVPENYSSMQ